MKTRLGYLLGVAASCLLLAGPVQARRIAIDQIPNPVPDDPDNPDESYKPFIPVTEQLSGYCDLSGEECESATALGYNVSFDNGANFTNLVNVTGNGILAFGSLASNDGSTIWDADVGGKSLRELIYEGPDPTLVNYQHDLVSAGQNNSLDGSVFYQSAALNVKNGVIKADWFTCYAPGPACKSGLYSMTLTPTATGFKGAFSAGQNGGSYVVNGQQVAIGNSFFLPATITGLATAVPEPASWALMIGGFGLVGGTLRRRSARPQAALA